MPHSEDPLLKAKILVPVENNVLSVGTNCHESSVNGAVSTPSGEPPTDAGIDVPEGITALGSIDIPTETDGDSKTASGFMLISVRHLSKAGREDLRNRSVSLPLKCRRSGSEPLHYNMFEPSHEDSSPTSSQSHAGEDEYSNDGFYGSGSIEAEEFEDDELDEDEAAHSVTLVVGASGKNLKSSLLKSATHPDASFFSNSIREIVLSWPRAAYASRSASSKGSFRATLWRVETSQRRSNNDLPVKYESRYQQTQLRWSLPSSWIGTLRRTTSVIVLSWPRAAYASRSASSKGSFRATLWRVETSQRRSNNDLPVKYESRYQQTQLRWSLPSSWIGTLRRTTSIVLSWPRAAYASRSASSKGSFRATLWRVETSQRRSNNDLPVKYESRYQQTQLRWSLPSSWIGTLRRTTSAKQTAFASAPTTKFGNDRCRVISSSDSALRGTWVTSNERAQEGACTLLTFPASGHLHSSRRRHRPVAPHGRYVVGKHDLVTKFQPIYDTLLPLVATARVQTNTSHFDSQVLACTPIPVTSVHTAPPSGHVSPPQPSEYAVMLEPLSLPEPYINGHVHPQSFSPHSVNHDSPTLTLHPPMYSLCNGPAHAPNSGSTQQPVACPHHLHTGGATELPPNSLMDGSNTNDGHLVPTVPSLNPATIPNLQPASRFRKARIHETVEQWSHGRASIHDCHLKAVPDWVWDLQKKSSTLEQDVASALFQKVNCSSCLERKVQAPNHPTSLQTQISVVSRQTGFSDTPRSNTSNLFASKSEIHGGTSALGRDAYRGSLFSFWDGGCRVNARLFNASRSAISHHLPPDEMSINSVCPICAGVVAGNTVEPSRDNLPETACIDDSVVNADRSDQCGQAITGDPSLLEDIKFASGPATGLGSSSTLSTPALLPSKSTDPATAYLIHQQISPATGIIMVNTDSAPKYIASPSAVPAHQSPLGRMHESHQLESGSFLGNGTQNQYKSRPGEFIQPPMSHKRDLSQDVSGFAPPTSPALLPPGDAQSVWSAVSCESFVARGTVNGLAHGAESNLDVPANRPHLEAQAPTKLSLPGDDHHPVMRLRDASGRYHNVAPMDSVYVTNGLDGHSTERPWTNLLSPMSPSDVYKTITKDSRSATDAPKGSKTTGRFPSPAVSKRYNTPLGSMEPFSVRSRSSTKSVPGKFYRESKSNSRGRLTLSKRLEARISESVDVIRSAIEEAFRDELAAAQSENFALLSEVERLSNEVSTLRGYQTAFHALRPFVAPEIWDHLCNQQSQSVQHHPLSASSSSAVRNGSPEHPG
ncbi:hypothetical protein T265_03893 [Opisthorchis viverrini]|uniref:Uncharacterized protein n=1 Tax=Opisthorchis viverrini TaxID=6198 RepID=A0A075A1T6_OPIVI|nr:hypothetical protein T265_03893 [Opisthorchis viverrini]KER29520.1 hypothetical protein T265_03893 [Opisthorchis viverrini]